MNETEFNLEQLKSVYKAQTEAYLDFNLALINILTNQQEIISKMEQMRSVSDEEFEKLSKEYYALEKLFVNFQNLQTERDTRLEHSTEEYTAQLSHFGAEMDTLRKDISTIKKMHWDLKNWITKAGWVAIGIGIVLSLLSSWTGKPLLEFFRK